MLTYFLIRLGALADRLAHAAFRQRALELDDMPGHPERLRPTGDPVVDTEFWDAAERLLHDPEEPNLSEVNDRWGWTR